MWPFFYNTVMLPIARSLLWGASKTNQKIKESLQEKAGLWDRMTEIFRLRDSRKPIVWFHAPSVGEYLIAQPIIDKLIGCNIDCLVTYNSISVRRWLDKTSGDFEGRLVAIEPLPLDTRKNVQRWLSLIQPSAVVFVIYDLWPNVIIESSKRGIPLFLVSATLKKSSARYRSRIARSFYSGLYKRFSGIFAVTETEKDKFLESSPGLSNIQVFGDSKIESAINRRNQLTVPDLPRSFTSKKILVAGSTWPPDEEIIFPGLKRCLERFDDFAAIIAPHEPGEEHLSHTETAFRDKKIVRFTQLRESHLESFDILLIDTIGVLSALYQYGDFAYVGGGYTTGVHNMLEPAVNGLPTMFGPRYQNAPEAVRLADEKLVFPIETSADFEAKCVSFLEQPITLSKQGKIIKEALEAQRGASEKCAQEILRGIS